MTNNIKEIVNSFDINEWWNSMPRLQQTNLANVVFNQLNEQYSDISCFDLTDKDKRILSLPSD